jgi:ferric iron reductase protein FhuF
VIALLEPIFRGEFAPLGERLVCAPEVPSDALRVADLASSTEMLAGVLHRHAKFRRAEGNDLRAVASAWSLAYLSVLLPPVAAAASVLQHGFPVAGPQMWVQFDGRGAPLYFHIRELGASLRGTDTAQRYAPLLWLHLAPLFAAVAGLTRLAPKILWGNVARVLEPILDQAVALTGGAASITQDRAHLLQSTAWPQTAANPLHGRQREVVQWRGGHQVPTKLHRQCCLNHLLPGETACGACPLVQPP